MVLYNSGQVASAAVVAYLGAKRRILSKTAIFMLHKAHNSRQENSGRGRIPMITYASSASSDLSRVTCGESSADEVKGLARLQPLGQPPRSAAVRPIWTPTMAVELSPSSASHASR